jgi:hypothetical protein
MKNKLIFISSFFFLLSGFIPLQGQTSLTLTKDIVVAKEEVQENVISFGGNILIEGKVKESVVAFGGTITVKGEVGDLVLGIGSTIILKSTAVIGGDVASLGGELTKEPGCIIDGDTIYFKTSEDVTKFLKEGLVGVFSLSLIPILLIIKLVTIFIWFLLAIAVAAIFPRQISFASSQIRKSFWPHHIRQLSHLLCYTLSSPDRYSYPPLSYHHSNNHQNLWTGYPFLFLRREPFQSLRQQKSLHNSGCYSRPDTGKHHYFYSHHRRPLLFLFKHNGLGSGYKDKIRDHRKLVQKKVAA